MPKDVKTILNSADLLPPVLIRRVQACKGIRGLALEQPIYTIAPAQEWLVGGRQPA